MPGESILTPIQRSVGVSAIKDSIYKEIEFRKETIMNEVIKAGEVFKLAELLPYQEGKIVNMDLAHNDKMKFVVMRVLMQEQVFQSMQLQEKPL